MTNLAELLKDAPKDLILYSIVFGDCKIISMSKNEIYCESIQKKINFTLNIFGQMAALNDDHLELPGECVLFPDAEHRTWDGWVKPWKDKKPKYEFEPFQKVLVRYNKSSNWMCGIYSHKKGDIHIVTGLAFRPEFCIPYNEHTKHFIGTTLPYEINVDISSSEDTKYNIEIRYVEEIKKDPKYNQKLKFVKILKDTYGHYGISLKEIKREADYIFGCCELNNRANLCYILPFTTLQLNEATTLVSQLKEIGIEAKFILIFNSFHFITFLFL